MGGNLFTTNRINNETFGTVSKSIVSKLNEQFNNTRCDVVPSYRNKESFGDIDILLEETSEVNRLDLLNLIKDLFATKKIVKNSNVYSFPFKFNEENNVQIDIIVQPSDIYLPALVYYSYNDLSNILGRVYHKLGFKFGHRGLSLVLRDKTHQFAEIIVSTDMEQILKFGNFDSDQYKKGFNDLEDIFVFATNTKFFNKQIFSYENRNHIARTRDKKRGTYSGFLKWLETQNNLPSYEYEDVTKIGGRVIKEEFLLRAYKYFPDLKEKYESALYQQCLFVKAREKFNGYLISELTGLKNIPLGKFMKHLKSLTSRDEILCATSDEIKQFVLTEYAEWRSQHESL